MGIRMRLDQLRYFVEAAQCGSISAAARKTRLAQPAFSSHIKMLEQDLGVALFQRSVKGIYLTEAGQRLYDRALSLFRHVDQIREETVSAGSELTGEVRIVLGASLAPLLAGKICWDTRQAYPGIRLIILDVMRAVGDNLVMSRQVNFGLLPNVATLAGASTEPVIAQELYLVGGKLPGEVGSQIDFKELSKYPLVMGGRKNQLRIDLENTAFREGGRINVAIEQDSFSVFRSIILNGSAYTVVPYSAFAVEIEAGLLAATRIVNPSIERTVSFVWHEFSDLSSSARAVMDLLTSRIRTMVSEGTLRVRLLV